MSGSGSICIWVDLDQTWDGSSQVVNEDLSYKGVHGDSFWFTEKKKAGYCMK